MKSTLRGFLSQNGPLIMVLAGLSVLLAAPVLAQAPVPGDGPFNLTLFHTNDSHSAFLPREATWRDDRKLIGGAVPLAWHLARERETVSADLFLDAGDFMTGNPVCEFAEDGVKGVAVARMMNLLGYDAGVIGNHEFDNGRENVVRLLEHFDFPLLAADLQGPDGEAISPRGPLILERGGLKVGIMGVSCAGMDEVVAPAKLDGLSLASQAELVRAQAADLDDRTDLLVLITHNGVGGDKELAQELEGSGVDVIVGGHSHSRLKRPLMEGGILIVQAGSKWTNLGRLDLQVEDDRIVRYDGRLVDLWAEGAVADPELMDLVSGYETRLQAEFGTQIGTLATEWRKGRGEHNLGNFLADQIRLFDDADVAFINGGGIRAGLAAGPITAMDIHRILPFSNSVVKMEMSGDLLADVIQQNANAEVSGAHGILQVSGVTYAFRAAPDGKTALVTEVLVDGRSLDRAAVYEAAMPDYVAMMAKVYLNIEVPDYEDSGVTLAECVIKAIKRSGPIDSRIEGRIQRLD